MKKNYFVPTIETTAIILSSVILDASSDDTIKGDMNNGFGSAPKRSTQPF